MDHCGEKKEETKGEKETPGSKGIAGGDFNAWSTEWGSRSNNLRGQVLLETFAVLGLGVANRGNALTFRRSGTGSIIDITLASSNLLRNIRWNVSEEYTGSDHQD